MKLAMAPLSSPATFVMDYLSPSLGPGGRTFTIDEIVRALAIQGFGEASALVALAECRAARLVTRDPPGGGIGSGYRLVGDPVVEIDG